MTRILRYFLLSTMMAFAADTVLAQAPTDIRGQHKVKRKETIFGIAKMYELKVEELIKANPEMNAQGYELKKGAVINIPYGVNYKKTGEAVNSEVAGTVGTTGNTGISASSESSAALRQQKGDVRVREVRVGVMLPLHDVNGDGRRMVEYYRGILMACDSLKKLGISVDVHAWNAAEDCDIQKILADPAAQQCDLIFGPLYSKQMDALSSFVEQNDVRLVIPFSISAPQLLTNRNIFQVWQSPTNINDATISHYLDKFKGYHPVFIDCNDSTSKKGVFTTGLRRQLEGRGIDYSVTNLRSSEEQFSKAFSRSKPNMVILNTGRSPELGVAFAKLNGLKFNAPSLEISIFGYTEWLMYTRTHLENLYKFNAYIPSTFYYNPLSAQTERLEQKFRWNFHRDMQQSLPRFALTGFDHAYFFIQGLHKYGKTFNGASGMFGYPPVQTPLMFERLGNGGLQNRSLMFVHYTSDHKIEMIQWK